MKGNMNKQYNNYGELVNTSVSGCNVVLMFSRPTGGVTDTIMVEMLCVDDTQAIAVERKHREAWGLPLVDRATTLEMLDLEEMQGTSQSMRELAEDLEALIG